MVAPFGNMTLAYWGFSRLAHLYLVGDTKLQVVLIKEMTTEQKRQTMFVGIDVHKDTHTAVGVSPFGEKMFEITVGNYKEDFETLNEKVKEHSGVLSPFFGLEDVRGYGERLAGYLCRRFGEKVRVAQ